MIIFEWIRWKNLLSTGNTWTEINLKSHPKTRLAGSNGNGKSTMVDALTFLLFGKPYRKINKPQLVNSTNQKELLVEGQFSISGVTYRIVRGIKPNIFEIYQNEVLINQESATTDYQTVLEKSILKMNIKSFTQIVVLGSASFVPFMQLPTPQRREVIEDLLDIQVFSVMNALLKKKVDANKESIKDLRYQIDLMENKIESANKYNDTIRVLHTDEIDNLVFKIRAFEEEIESGEELITDLQEKINALTVKVEGVGYSEQKLNKFKSIENDLKSKIKTLNKEITFYDKNDSCPTCKQSIEEHFRCEEIAARNGKIQEINSGFDMLNKEIEASIEKMNETNRLTSEISKLNLDITKEYASLSILRKSISNTEKDMAKAKERQNSNNFQDIAQLNKQLNDFHDAQNQNFEERDILAVAASLLKDGGIKSAIIKQYIPIINSLVNQYLESLEFFVNFELDENFNETIKSRHRDVFSYGSFSEGEKAKIDLALLLTWREVSRLRNSMSTNLLIMDEVFDGSLDMNGTDLLMDIFNSLGDSTNIFVISHKNDQLGERFDRTLKFQKERGFSRLVED